MRVAAFQVRYNKIHHSSNPTGQTRQGKTSGVDVIQRIESVRHNVEYMKKQLNPVEYVSHRDVRSSMTHVYKITSATTQEQVYCVHSIRWVPPCKQQLYRFFSCLTPPETDLKAFACEALDIAIKSCCRALKTRQMKQAINQEIMEVIHCTREQTDIDVWICCNSQLTVTLMFLTAVCVAGNKNQWIQSPVQPHG